MPSYYALPCSERWRAAATEGKEAAASETHTCLIDDRPQRHQESTQEDSEYVAANRTRRNARAKRDRRSGTRVHGDRPTQTWWADRTRAMLKQRTSEQARARRDAIGTLHDMRVVFFDNDTRMLFATVFDGTWD